MATYTRKFTCVVNNQILGDLFSAKVTVQKKAPIRSSRQSGKIDLADVFITPVSGAPNSLKIHHHFVLYNFSGKGLYIVRNLWNKEEHRIPCTVWDLGHSFGEQVMNALKELA